MKNLFVSLLLLTSFSTIADDAPFIISGFDDVLRQAENTSLFKATLKILEADKTFAGMPELYRQITIKEPGPKFVIVSAISTWFDGRIEGFLEQMEYPVHTNYLRNWFTEWSIEDFKISRIKSIMAERPNRKFMVIFDNSDASLTMAKKLHALFPSQIQAIYLRKVVERKLPENSIYFHTAFDIAIHEYSQKRLSLDAVKKVAAAILTETRKFLVIPSYALCPKDYGPCLDPTPEVKEICQLVRDHVRNLCLR